VLDSAEPGTTAKRRANNRVDPTPCDAPRKLGRFSLVDVFRPEWITRGDGQKSMKRLLFVLWFLVPYAVDAALPYGEEIEFRYEPSFHDGTLVWLARLPDGSVQCLAYSLPSASDDGVVTHGRPAKIKEVAVDTGLFDRLVAAIEGAELRSAAERSVSSGIDGSMLIFRRKAGARSVEFRFWSPGADSPAMRLADRFLSAAQLPEIVKSQRKAIKAVDPTPGNAPRDSGRSSEG